MGIDAAKRTAKRFYSAIHRTCAALTTVKRRYAAMNPSKNQTVRTAMLAAPLENVPRHVQPTRMHLCLHSSLKQERPDRN
jgi:hypothetical protein